MAIKILIDGDSYLIESEDAINIKVKSFSEVKNKTKENPFQRNIGGDYWILNSFGVAERTRDLDDDMNKLQHIVANYHTDGCMTADFARAETIMRKLRRFSLEHAKGGGSWNARTTKFCILFDHTRRELFVTNASYMQYFGQIYFETFETAETAIKEFEADLLWYFKDYSTRKLF